MDTRWSQTLKLEALTRKVSGVVQEASMKWWEKTVEYLFVARLAATGRLLFPLAGDEERAGDAVFSSNHRWLLIEFKRDANSLENERRKFLQYDAAKAELQGQDAHHVLIFGVDGKQPTQQLQLVAQTYFSRRHPASLEEILNAGIEFEAFMRYVERFTEFKKKGGRTSAGGVTPEQLGLVAGINADGKVVDCLSMREFQRRREMRLEQAHEQEHEAPTMER